MSKRYLKTEFIKQFIPIRSLPASDLTHVAKQSPIAVKAANTCIFTGKTSTQYYWYLVKGQLLLTNAQSKQQLSAGSESAHFPFLSPSDHNKSVTTLEKVILLRVHKQHFAKINQAMPADASKEDEPLYQQLYDDYESGKLALPSLPDMAFRIRSACQNTSSNAKTLARILQVDPAITARVLQIVNSPLYRGTDKIVTCESAISRLGMEGTKNLVVAFTMQQLFTSKNELLKTKMQQLWLHSAEVSAMSYILARATQGLDPDLAMLAGLLHDIGTVAILSHAEEYQLLTSDDLLDKAIHGLNGRIGAMLLNKWGFDPSLVQVAAESEHWLRNPTEQPDYCDIVLLAQLHSYIGSPNMNHLPVISEVPAFGKIAMGKLSPQRSLMVLDKAKEEISNIKILLGAI
jgi:putative nucleotidyltransferase with HDIG domain